MMAHFYFSKSQIDYSWKPGSTEEAPGGGGAFAPALRGGGRCVC